MFTLIFIFVVAGFFLPEWMAVYMDQNTIGSIKKESAELPTIIPGNSISMIEKISLLKDYPQNVNQVALERGANFDLRSARDKFFEEITELSKHEILPRIELEGKGHLKINASLYIQKDESFISGIFWSITLQQDEFLGNFYMDDHTGKIIQFSLTMRDEPSIIEKELIETWAKYLGFEVQKIESQSKPLLFKGEDINEYESRFYEYNFEFKFQEDILPYTFYTFDNGYGFGNIMIISSYNDIQY